MAEKFYHTRFGDYRGGRRYTVSHPRHKDVCVAAAPDDCAAIMAAANYWGERFQSYDFYAYCSVSDGDLRASTME